MSKAVFCFAKSQVQAQDITSRLRQSGFSGDDISVLFPDRTGTRDFAHEHNTKAPEGTVTGAGTGGAVGGAVGWMIGIGALAIPGVGPFIAAGPIMAALAGAAVGATVGGITGALIGMGIPEYEAKRYEGKIKEGNILISVHTTKGDEVEKAKRIFKEAKADDITTAGETSVKGERADTNMEHVDERRKSTTDVMSGRGGSNPGSGDASSRRQPTDTSYRVRPGGTDDIA